MRRALIGLAFMVSAHSAWAEDVIEVFKLTSQSVRNTPGAKVYDVDALQLMADRLSEGLPPSPELAKAAAMARFQGMSDKDKANLQYAARVVGQAAHYGIRKVPAIVFNRRAVIYGVPDVGRARVLYLQWAQQHPKEVQ